MKKKSFLVVLLLCLGLALFADDNPPVFPWRIWGYVSSNAVLRVELNRSELPFDIDSRIVDKNTKTDKVKGILAGTYSLICNNQNFILTVTHDNLVNVVDKNETIGYRLDVFDSSKEGFKTIPALTVSGDQVTVDSTKESVNLEIGSLSGKDNEGPWGMINKAFYVSLWWKGDNDPRGELAPGLYQSTITFTVEVKQ